MLASEVIANAAEIYGDEANETILLASQIKWLNDALRALVSVRPDVSAVVASKQLTPGTRQQLVAAGDLRLLSLVCNMGADGNTPGRGITYFDRADMDAFNPGWHADTAGIAVYGYTFDAQVPHEFYVTPPVHATTPVYVRVSKAVSPGTIVAGTDVLTVDDIYAPALVEWMCYRAFSRDSEETPNWARAARHFSSFFNVLQVKMQADMASNPKIHEQAARLQSR
jgi:hypothetical protein